MATPESCSTLVIQDVDGRASTRGVVSADGGGHNQAYDECLAQLGEQP